MSFGILCQTVGCCERAEPWGIEIELGALLVRLVLCRRHERELGWATTSPTVSVPSRVQR